ncbi:hypothetical protein BFJ66_g7020 [Fusarium oxysporum f. sp. cepae]|uniref:Uncharacterized protein n=1 Tax=Fusarium oxysporum f. sp. cepae TaxID=396571 RepID=A0A3L6MUG7_FUSOX|nr:hypothetical protein BFJ65_g16224 [Fusarium oxysporum f. sp. cepae]RKK49509.1 hypothetical protein BFJ66_g7020 [Fusarium oxysporum f. sp. cepae]
MNNQRDIDLAPLSSSNNVENGDSQRGAFSCSPPSSEDSPIRHLLEHHQRFLTDAHAPTFASFHLSSQHFDTYEAEISRLFRRYDYDRNRATITIRMPSQTHNGFLHKLLLRAQAPKKIWSRQPDLQIGERNTQFPGCVVEVACSQSSADLEPLAYDYFSNTSFGVQLFIFVDIKENARISILRGNAGVVSWGMQQVEFQTADKHPANINVALELNVKDFVLSTEIGQYPDLAIRIPFQELHEMLRQARRDSLVKKGRGGNIRRPNKFDGEMVLPANF